VVVFVVMVSSASDAGGLIDARGLFNLFEMERPPHSKCEGPTMLSLISSAPWWKTLC